MIEAFRAAKEKQGSTKTTTTDGGASTMTTSAGKKARKVSDFYYTVADAGHPFNRQLTKDNEIKQKCLTKSVEGSKRYPDKLRFEFDFRKERERLVDSKNFCDTCKTLGIEAATVADHVVFEGKSVVNHVLRDGLQVVFGDKARMFNKPLWVDSEKLFEQAAAKEVAHV